MTLGNDDRRLHDGERRTDERLAGLLHHTPQRPQTPFWHAVADVRVVVGRGGVPRLVLLVARCPGCHRPHMHLARVPFTATIRKAGCGTRYTVHALNDEAVA